ncbi:hypothetical protein BH23CHL7_BH23CHL7_22530 [soil metagenome]
MTKPTLISNPTSDDVFGAFAELLVEHDVASPRELQVRLRVAYPDAVVHERLLSAERRTVWYVYRDGHWVNDHRIAGQEGASQSVR